MYKINGILRSSFKFISSSSLTNVLRLNTKPDHAKQRLYSTFWNNHLKLAGNNTLKSTVICCEYSAANQYSTKSENELAEFLEQEITAEQKLQKHKTIPSKIDDFEVKLNGSEVTLIKSTPGETIEISFNINHSVDNFDEDYGADVENDEDQPIEVKSKPNFEIDIKRGDTTLGFSCVFMNSNNEVEDDGDVYAIEEVTMYKGEFKDEDYSVSGNILDGYLYDLLMNFLDDKGVTREFVLKLSELSTAYEHSSYISLLRDLRKFVSS